ncbi:MAG: CPBP family intramembrane metalloprotease [Phycisphaera sp.]|nr:MAG: CPBP family intramembrane metalloprotease [Phycisphaera sp.]
MSAADETDLAAVEETELESYWQESTRPLQVLVFLLPLVLFYEFGSVFWQQELATIGLAARRLLETLFEIFGVFGMHLPALTLVAVLVSWHLLERRPWRIRPSGLIVMAAESCIWAAPILVLAAMTGLLGGGVGDTFAELPAGARATTAIGAGVYEELVFRFVLIAMAHGLLVDICGVREQLGNVLAVGFSALVFAAYHRSGVDGQLHVAAVIFFFASGVYLGTLFLGRGLGIAAGAHAIYDLLVLVAFPAISSGG